MTSKQGYAIKVNGIPQHYRVCIQQRATTGSNEAQQLMVFSVTVDRACLPVETNVLLS